MNSSFSGSSKLVIDDLPEVAFRKLMRMKDAAGFTDKSWSEYFTHMTNDMFLDESIEERIQKNTRDNLLKLWCQNLADNLEAIRSGDTIKALVPKEAEADPNVILGPAIVVGRGPSIFKHKHLDLLGKKGFKGAIIASDGALIECLKRGVIPTHVVSVDGNREKIWKWYDHPLVDKYGSGIKAMLCCMVANSTLKRIEQAGMPHYWFNPQFDDYRQNESWTRMQMHLTSTDKYPNGVCNVSCGGNAGATAWVMATQLLRRSPTALIGLDMGYPVDTPFESTSYYNQMMEGAGGNVPLVLNAYRKIHNSRFDCDGMLDPVFSQYRDSFFNLLKQTRPEIRTVNVTEGGCLFSDDPKVPLEYMKFSEFLNQYGAV